MRSRCVCVCVCVCGGGLLRTVGSRCRGGEEGGG